MIDPHSQVQTLLIYPGTVTLPFAAKPTYPVDGLSICGSQTHSISALISAHTCPDSLNPAGNLLFLFSAFTLLIPQDTTTLQICQISVMMILVNKLKSIKDTLDSPK
jgi:hypothetical protein